MGKARAHHPTKRSLRRFRKRLAVAPLITAVLAIAPASAAAGDGFNTFTGSCEFTGSVVFDPPIGLSEQRTSAEARAAGPCTGTWQRPSGKVWNLDGDRVRYRAQSTGTQSCGSAEAAGDGFLRYRHRKLRFLFFESRIGASASIRLEGRGGGLFTGTAEGDPAEADEIAQACLTSGVSQAGFTLPGSTDPSISG